jgi:hypothetical protein
LCAGRAEGVEVAPGGSGFVMVSAVVVVGVMRVDGEMREEHMGREGGLWAITSLHELEDEVQVERGGDGAECGMVVGGSGWRVKKPEGGVRHLGLDGCGAHLEA